MTAGKQYQVVVAKLQGVSRTDEEALTDLLNERARAGWTFRSQAVLGDRRLLLIFEREA